MIRKLLSKIFYASRIDSDRHLKGFNDWREEFNIPESDIVDFQWMGDFPKHLQILYWEKPKDKLIVESKREYQVIINGKPYHVIGDKVSYEMILELLQMAGQPSIMFHNGIGNLEGTLIPNKAVFIKDGIIFDCVHTGNA